MFKTFEFYFLFYLFRISCFLNFGFQTFMLLKASQVQGLKVVSLKEGKTINKVKDILYDPEEQRVIALLITGGGFFFSPKVVLYQDIKKIGKDAVIIDSETVIQNATEIDEKLTEMAKGETFLTDTKIVTDEGSDLGNIQDIYFDEATGGVEEFEVSQGMEDLKSGRKTIRIADIITIGEDATIVKAATEQEIERQSQQQGLQGALNRSRQKSTQTFENSREQVSENESLREFKKKLVNLGEKAKQDLEYYQDDIMKLKNGQGRKEYVDKTKHELDNFVNKAQQRGIHYTHTIRKKAKNHPRTGQAMNDLKRKSPTTSGDKNK